jgi:excisionase family DNA binding protein
MSEERRFSVEEFSQLMNVSECTVYRWIKLDKIRPYKPVGKFFFTQSMVDEFLAASKSGTR